MNSSGIVVSTACHIPTIYVLEGYTGSMVGELIHSLPHRSRGTMGPMAATTNFNHESGSCRVLLRAKQVVETSFVFFFEGRRATIELAFFHDVFTPEMAIDVDHRPPKTVSTSCASLVCFQGKMVWSISLPARNTQNIDTAAVETVGEDGGHRGHLKS